MEAHQAAGAIGAHVVAIRHALTMVEVVESADVYCAAILMAGLLCRLKLPETMGRQMD